MTKFRGLAGMDSVAMNNKNTNNISSNNDIDNNTEDDFKNQNDIDVESHESNSIEDIIKEIENKEKGNNKKRQIAFYLDEDIAKAFDRYAKKNGKGAKSELIEKLLQSTLRKAGYLK